MVNLTVRNIPEELIEKIKIIAEMEKRSLNNEILIVLENGLKKEIPAKRKYISKETQVKIWKNLSGMWEDTRKTEEIIEDIYSNRTLGREVEL